MDRQCKVRAVRLAVMSFEQLLRGQLKLLADNTTAIAYICNQGGIHSVPPSWNGCSCGVPSATSLSVGYFTIECTFFIFIRYSNFQTSMHNVEEYLFSVYVAAVVRSTAVKK